MRAYRKCAWAATGGFGLAPPCARDKPPGFRYHVAMSGPRSSPTDACKNCERFVPRGQRYCGHCGQQVATHRIDGHFILHTIQHGWLHVDRGIMYTLRELIVRPGHAVRDYLAGKRISHVNPVQLLLLIGTLYFLLGPLVARDEFEVIRFTRSGNAMSANIDHALENVFTWLNRHPLVIVCSGVPLVGETLRGRFKAYPPHYNGWEWLTIGLFIALQFMLVHLLMLPLLLMPWDMSLLPIAASLALAGRTCLQLYPDVPRFKLIANVVWAVVLAFVAYAVVLIGLVALYVAVAR